MEKRCAYFGCMHPMFESEDWRQKYCSDECAKRAHDRLPSAKASRERSEAKRTPEQKKEKLRKTAASNYRNIMARKKLPPWMES